jgi:uncharacterized protein YdeI (YjbR/CyaY-like superfamily)
LKTQTLPPDPPLQFFATAAAFRRWLAAHHQSATEVYVGFHKVKTGRPSLSWSESVDQALCFGWIDGVRKSLGEDAYYIRFTPRKPGSIWSSVNIAKMEALTRQGLVAPAGHAAFAHRKESKSRIYAYEKEEAVLSAAFLGRFQQHPVAWTFFQSLPPSYRRSAIDWVMSAKAEATRLRRLEELISDSAQQKKIKRLSY